MRRILIVAATAMLALAAPALAGGPMRGTSGDDTLTGTAEADAIFARAGDDTVNAGAGDDRAHGGRGADTLNGEDGNDRLKGGGGEDTISGGAGDDTIDARGDGGSADAISCGDGADTVRAGRNDVVADDCETATQPGKPATAGKPDDAGDKAKGPKEPEAVTAAVKPAPSAAKLARQACRTEKHEMGTKVFKLTYAAKSTSKAMAACVAKAQPVAATELKNAAQTCKAERAVDAAAFADKYGANENDKNALGKCVSTKSEEAVEETTDDRVNAAKTCKAARAESADAFAEAWGAKKNAFGKCVSATAKADDDEDQA